MAARGRVGVGSGGAQSRLRQRLQTNLVTINPQPQLFPQTFILLSFCLIGKHTASPPLVDVSGSKPLFFLSFFPQKQKRNRKHDDTGIKNKKTTSTPEAAWFTVYTYIEQCYPKHYGGCGTVGVFLLGEERGGGRH